MNISAEISTQFGRRTVYRSSNKPAANESFKCCLKTVNPEKNKNKNTIKKFCFEKEKNPSGEDAAGFPLIICCLVIISVSNDDHVSLEGRKTLSMGSPANYGH